MRDEPDDGDFSCREGKQTSWKCRFSLSLLCVRLCLFLKETVVVSSIPIEGYKYFAASVETAVLWGAQV